jgi:hypothetical protein
LGVLQILPQHDPIHLAFRLTSAAFTEKYLRRLQPQEFTMLKTGGVDCDMQVDGIIFQAGRRWRSDPKDPRKLKNHVRQSFTQVYG